MTLVKYRPQSSINRFFDNDVPHLFDWLFDSPARSVKGHQPLTNIREEKDRFLIELAAPGNTRTDFKVSVENDELVIALNRNEKSEEGNSEKGYWRQEFRTESFEKRFYLGDNIKRDDINAKYDAGILKVDVPKQQPAEPISIEIK